MKSYKKLYKNMVKVIKPDKCVSTLKVNILVTW